MACAFSEVLRPVFDDDAQHLFDDMANKHEWEKVLAMDASMNWPSPVDTVKLPVPTTVRDIFEPLSRTYHEQLLPLLYASFPEYAELNMSVLQIAAHEIACHEWFRANFPQDMYDAIEKYSGKRALQKAWRAHGCKSIALDKKYWKKPGPNALFSVTPEGFHRGGSHAGSTRNGLVWARVLELGFLIQVRDSSQPSGLRCTRRHEQVLCQGSK